MKPSDNNMHPISLENQIQSPLSFEEWVHWMLEDLRHQTEAYHANLDAMERWGLPIMPFAASVDQPIGPYCASGIGVYAIKTEIHQGDNRPKAS